MPDVYSLNPNAPTRSSRKGADRPHHIPAHTAILAIAIVIVALLYWWWNSRTPEVEIDRQQQLRAEVAAILQNTPRTASPDEINRIAEILSKSPSPTSQEDRARVSSSLQNI
jgi:hypothetical protein